MYVNRLGVESHVEEIRSHVFHELQQDLFFVFRIMCSERRHPCNDEKKVRGDKEKNRA